MKTIAFLLSVGCGVILLVALSLTGQAQQQPPPAEPQAEETGSGDPSDWRATSEELEPLWEEARQRKEAEEYLLAADTYQQILVQLPPSSQAQKAAYLAGSCLAAAGRPADAVGMFDQVLAIGRDLTVIDYYNPTGHERKLPALGKRLISVRAWMEESLHHKALICRDIGDTQGALAAIRRLHVEFPNSGYISRLTPLYAELVGATAQEAQMLVVQEEEASQLFKDAHSAFHRGEHTVALPLLDQLLAEYPESAVAVRASADKAMILWGWSRFSEARVILLDILNRVGAVAPDSAVVRLAESRVAWLNMGREIESLIRYQQLGFTVVPQEWEQARTACLTVMSKEEEASLRAEANVAFIETYCHQGDYDKVLEEAKYFFRNYGGAKKAALFPRQIAWVHLFAGTAAERLGLTDQAISHFQAVAQMYESDPTFWRGQSVVASAYRGLGRIH